MGLKDEDYANALEHQRLHQVALMKLEMQKQMKEKQMSGLMNSLGNLIGAGQQQALNSNGLSSSAYAQQQAALAQQAGSITYTGTSPYSANPTTGTFTPVGLKVLTEKDIHHDAMKAPLSALVDMWTMRWQGNWVNESEFDEDDFWRLALVRLLGASKLEKHNLADQHRSVYRIIE